MDKQYNNYDQYRKNTNEENNHQNQDYHKNYSPNENANSQNQQSYYQERMQYGRNGQEQYHRRNHRQYFHRNQENMNKENMTQEQYNQSPNNYHNTQENITHQINGNQQGKMIKNPKTNIAQDKNQQMNDRDYLNDILATEKYLSDGYNTFLLESSHTELHTDVKQILNETHDCAREVFNLMFENGFYSFQAASPQEIQKAQTTYSKYLNQQSPYMNDSDLL